MSGKKNASDKQRILYDGWPLAFDPCGAAALHTFELVDALPGGFEAWLALPEPVDLPADLRAQPLVFPQDGRPASQMRWEQQILPAAARRAGAGLIHTTSLNLPLVSSVPCLVSPVEPYPRRPSSANGLAGRLRGALGRGGLAGARAVLWPDDSPDPQPLYPAPLCRLPPIVHRAFFHPQDEQVQVPDAYVLVPGPLNQDHLAFLAAAWSWAAAGLDESWSLVVSNLLPPDLAHLRRLCLESFAFDRVETIELRTPEQRAEAYQKAAAVLHVGGSPPWGDALLQAVAAACPLAAPLSAGSDRRVGPAGFLVAPGDARALGAAVLTLLVEAPLAQEITQRARERCAAWQVEAWGDRLAEIYDRAMHPIRSGG